MGAEEPVEALSDVIRSGNQRRSLEAIRDHLAAQLEDLQYAKDVAPIAKQLCDVIARLDELPDDRRESPADDLAKQRAERRKKAAGS